MEAKYAVINVWGKFSYADEGNTLIKIQIVSLEVSQIKIMSFDSKSISAESGDQLVHNISSDLSMQNLKHVYKQADTSRFMKNNTSLNNEWWLDIYYDLNGAMSFMKVPQQINNEVNIANWTMNLFPVFSVICG